MDRQTIVEGRPYDFMQDMRQHQITPDVTKENGWFKSQMPLEFDGVPVGKVVEQWLAKVRGALRNTDSRVLVAGCMMKNIDPNGTLGLKDHPRIVWWYGDKKSDNRRAAGLIPVRVALALKLRFCRHSLSDEIARQAKQRGIVDIPLLSAADTQKLLRLGLMEASDLERRLRPSIPSPISKLMEYGSPRAIATTNTLLHGQIHKLVQGDDIPAPLEPVPVLPPIFDRNGDPMPREATNTQEPVKKKRIIVNKHVGPVQRVLMQNEEVSLDRSLNYTERARRLIDKCREAGLVKTSIASLALAIATYQDADDKKTAAAAARAAATPAPVAAVVEPPEVAVVEPPKSGTPQPPDGSVIGRILSLIEQQSAELKLAEEHIALGRLAQDEIAENIKGAIAEARGEARKALEQTLRNMGLS